MTTKTRRDLTLLICARQRMLLCPEHLANYESCPDDAGEVRKVASAVGCCAACDWIDRAIARNLDDGEGVQT